MRSPSEEERRGLELQTKTSLGFLLLPYDCCAWKPRDAKLKDWCLP